MGFGPIVDTLECMIFSSHVAARTVHVVGSVTVYNATRDSRMSAAPSSCSKRYPCFRVATITLYIYHFTPTDYLSNLASQVANQIWLVRVNLES
jgi:hypothetical protein